MVFNDCQCTVGEPVSCSGVGMHSGKRVKMTIHPAPVNHGIKFLRRDLPDNPCVAAHFNLVVDTSLATVIGNDGFIVSTIEHLMASFAGLGVDNALVELNAYEVPIMDGSAQTFTDLIKRAGIRRQPGNKYCFIITKPIELSRDEKFVAVYPDWEPRISYTIDFDHPMIGRQSLSVALTNGAFENEICWARTFGFLNEIEYLKKYGFAKGGSLDNVVVVDAQTVMNADGLRSPDEFVRHKILDCIGDFSLLGMPIIGHIKISKSGHAFNHAFLREFFARKDAWHTALSHELLQQLRPPLKNLAI